MLPVIMSLAAALFSGAASAYNSGNALFAAMNSSQEQTFAMMYVAGAAEGYQTGHIIGYMRGSRAKVVENSKPGDGGLCVPPSVNYGQLSDVVKKWLSENPARRHEPPISLIFSALNSAFPC
ncbi:Rap1a/Tai family immunity protein [Polaromonas sp.]|uniref:Rap1a/Tai family immunity protein n=1 Tax=Polaromonas sp. TaxID=1869339 RepID=UPI003CB966FB